MKYLVVNSTFPFLTYNFILLKGEMDISKNRKVSLFNHYPSYYSDLFHYNKTSTYSLEWYYKPIFGDST